MFSFFKMSKDFGGLSDSFEYHEFEFDSFDCLNSYDQNYYTSDWPNFLLGKPLDNVAAIKILEAQIPFTFYLFNSVNNTFSLNEWITGGTVNTSGTQKVTIPPGNYTYLTLPSVLGAALTYASTLGSSPNSYTYSVTYQASTMSLKIVSNSTAATGDFFTLTFGTSLNDPGKTNPRLYLGMSGGAANGTASTPGLYTFCAGTTSAAAGPVNGTSGTPAYPITFAGGLMSSAAIGAAETGSSGATTFASPTFYSPSVVEFNGPNYIFIKSRTLGGDIHLYVPGNELSRVVQAGADGPDICKIPMTVNAGQVFNWVDPAPKMWFDVGGKQFGGYLDFYCTLGAGAQSPVQFNGAGFSLKLGILTNKNIASDFVGGGAQNSRVVTRSSAMQF